MHGYSHHLNAEVLKELMDYKESSASSNILFPALNFEMDIVTEIPVVLQKMKNVCMRNNIPMVDVRINCSYEGPVKNYSCSQPVEVAWTAMNVDSGTCTLERIKKDQIENVRERSSKTYTVSYANNETFIFTCKKDGIDYEDRVLVYCALN